jgi:hypothetical protein
LPVPNASTGRALLSKERGGRKIGRLSLLRSFIKFGSADLQYPKIRQNNYPQLASIKIARSVPDLHPLLLLLISPKTSIQVGL